MSYAIFNFIFYFSTKSTTISIGFLRGKPNPKSDTKILSVLSLTPEIVLGSLVLAAAAGIISKQEHHDLADRIGNSVDDMTAAIKARVEEIMTKAIESENAKADPKPVIQSFLSNLTLKNQMAVMRARQRNI